MAKVPPSSQEAEEAVIGSVLIDPNVINDIMEIVNSSDFYYPKNRLIFQAIEKLYDEGEPVDVISVSEKLKAMQKLDVVGGELEVARLADVVPTAAHVAHYAKIVRDKSILRQLITASSRIVEMASEESDIDEVLDSAEKLIFEIAESRALKNYSHIKQIMHDVFEELEKVQERAEELGEAAPLVTGIPTGFSELDKLTTGFHKSDFVIIAARPSVGKTAFALSLARNMAIKYSTPVGIFSLEMSAEQLAQRLLAMEAHVDLHKLRTGEFTSEEWDRLTVATEKLYKSNIVVDDEASLDPRTLRAKARRMKKEFGIDVIFVDYLQLMHLKSSKENRQQEISEISRSLKLLARELDVVIIALSQLSRAVEQRENKRPRLSDLRESGAIEQDADTVIFIYREEYYKKSDRIHEPHEAEIIIGKQRNGPIGTVTLVFDPSSVTFYDLDILQLPM
ncbi:MAG: replicative DNA helicase [Thermotogaceae bacterium]|nr:replicative DNA helicase [Thermotogaceae bacterium]